MTSKQVEYFLRVCTCRNIAAAAEELFVSRPVISKAILTLEEEVGAPLFLRSKEGVEPTEAGKVLYHTLQEFESGYINALEKIRCLNDENSGQDLFICVTPTNGMQVTRILLNGFCRDFPKVRLHVTEIAANQTLDALLNRKADAVFSPSREELSGRFGTLNIFQSRLMVGVSSEYQLSNRRILTIGDILNLPLGTLATPMPIEDAFSACCKAMGKIPNIVIRASQTEMLRIMTENGHIASILPDDILRSWQGITAIPLDFLPLNTHRLIWDNTKRHNTAFSDFIRYAQSKISVVFNAVSETAY